MAGHYARKLSRVSTMHCNLVSKFLSVCFCTNSQPAHAFFEPWSKTIAQTYKENVTHNQDQNYEAEDTRRSKWKYAILLSYSGKNYFGLQRNPNVITIEQELLAAMLKAGVISQSSYEDTYRLYFQRASRTDKGVSALRQVISLYLQKAIDFSTVTKINSYLPSQVQVMDIKRVSRGFDAKDSCNSRLYSYMLPTFALSPIDVLCTEAYRLPSNRVEEINSVLKQYEGRHNFHNFTNHRKPEDKSCFRHILLCECGQPFTVGGLEFAIIRIKGHSFMLYQIRKMLGLAVGVIRGLANKNTLIKSFNDEKLNFPMVPSLGLMLEEIYYDNYNLKRGDGIFEPIAWEQFQNKLYSFKEKYIHSDIIETEIRERSMMKWLQQSFCYTYDVKNADKENSYDRSNLYRIAIYFKPRKEKGILEENHPEATA